MTRYIEGAPQALPAAPWDIEGCEFGDVILRVVEAVRRLETLGGATVAGEAAGPWVVRVTVRGSTRWHSRTGPAESFLDDASTYDARAEADAAAAEWGTDYAATVLSLAEAERMEAAAKPTPEPPKPAGWVVRGIGTDGAVRFSRGGDRSFATDLRGAYVYESKPLADADAESGGTWRDVVVLPVDAAGNVIEAEDIGATLRREECERKAARQSGVAWEAARAGEEAERLRAEVARLHETLRDVGALADEHANEWHALLDHARTAADEVCGPQPVISAREAVTLIERKAFDLRTDAERLRTELAAVKAERAAVLSNAAVLDTSLRRLRTDHATTLAERDKWAANAGTLNASLRQVHTECDQLRAELDATLAERDALAAEVQRAREQKPVRWAVVLATGHVASVWHEPDIAAEVAATVAGRRVAPLYLAPVVRDHSGVIAQCEAYLAGDYELGEPRPGPHDVIAAALAALQGAS